MASFPSLIILTLVTLSLVTPTRVFAEDSKKDTDYMEEQRKAPKDPCKVQDEMVTSATNAYNKFVSDPKNKEMRTGNVTYDKLDAEKKEAVRKLEQCETKKEKALEKSNASCEKWEKERKDILKDFSSPAQTAARLCLHANEEDGEIGYAKIMLQTMVGQTESGKKECDLGGAKTANKEKRGDLDNDVKELEKDLRKADNEILKKKERVQDELAKMNEDRRRMKEEYENSMDQAESAQVKAMGNLRDRQIQLADNIRKLQTSAITARQNVNSIQAELKAAMSFAKPPGDEKGSVNLRSEQSIKNYCVLKAKQAAGSGSSKSASAGASRTKTYKDTLNTCVESLHDHRANLAQSFTNSLEHRLNQQKEIEEQIATATKQYAQLTEDYNTTLKQLEKKLTKGQANYYEADNALANRINELQQNAQQEQMKLAMEKMQDQQKIIGKYNSQGRLSEADAQEIRDTSEDLEKVEKNMKTKCPDHADLVLTSEKVEKSVEKAKERAEEAEANQ